NSTQTRISDIYKFDLSTEKWGLEKVKLNLDADKFEGGQAGGLSLDIYNEKLISYMTLMDMKTEQFIPKLATLDYKAKEWEWTWLDINNDDGTDNSLILVDQHTIVINDQLLMFHGYSNQKASKKTYVLDLKTNKLQGFVNISGKYGQETASSLPTWAIILITVICVLVFIFILAGLWFYLRYKKRVKPGENGDQKMQDIWAASDVEVKGNIKGNTTLTFGNTVTSTGQAGTALNEDSMMNYDCFKHEVDLDDMEDTKVHTKI
ncbi:hypothetical protein CONCODRAFT_10951, partial [Conidiobolus coronatus NRRL 28638]